MNYPNDCPAFAVVDSRAREIVRDDHVVAAPSDVPGMLHVEQLHGAVGELSREFFLPLTEAAEAVWIHAGA